MKRVFADTHYWLALLNRRDQDHARAVGFRRRQRFDEVVTTLWVLAEVADGMRSPAARVKCAGALADLRHSQRVQIIGEEAGLFWRGFSLFEKRPDKEWSFTDCISFVVMAEEELAEALTADHYFEQAGFTALMLADG